MPTRGSWTRPSPTSQGPGPDPQYANAYHLRAIAYFGQGKFANAWQDVKRAQFLGERVDPDFLDQLRQSSHPFWMTKNSRGVISANENRPGPA